MRSQRSEPWGHLGTQIGGVALVLAIVGGWIVWRVYSTVPTPARPRTTSSALVQAVPAPQVSTTTSAEPSSLTTDGPAMDADPDPSPPPVIGSPDPDLDRLVQKATLREPIRGEVVNLAPIGRKAARRTPAAVAADADAAIDRKLAGAGVPASSPADDAEFLRRVYLDLVGVIPNITRTKAFLADRTPDKRARLVEELLTDPQYGQHFAHYWHELLVKRDPDNNAGIKTHDVFLKWLTHQFSVNRPWDETVRAMLTATGDQALAGETFFILANSDNGQPAANRIVGTAAALFLGNQLMCAECHIHPVNKDWRQQDFWGLAAFFRKTRADRPKSKNPNDVLAKITDEPGPPPATKKGAVEPAPELPGGAIAIPDPRNEGQFIGAARPAFMGGKAVDRARATRKVAAEWFTAADNPYFARAAVNRLWSQFFGRGFVNPLDDIRPDSETVHPEVLQLLAEEFVASRFDLKHLIRCITSTQAYQRTSRTIPANADDQELYSHMALKVLPPRVLFRSLAVATGEKIKAPGEDPPPTKKKEAPPIGLGFFDSREYDESPIEYTYGVPQLLRLLNTLLPPACDAMAVVANRQGGAEKAVEHLYLTTLSRRPTTAEAKKAADFVARQRDPVKGYSTVAWALLIGAEFVNNH
jgi:hypothetical protein